MFHKVFFYPVICFTDLTRRNLDVDERRYLVGRGVVSEIQSNMGEYVWMLLHLSTSKQLGSN